MLQSVFLVLPLLATQASAATYYASSSVGKSTNDGLTATTPVDTLRTAVGKLNAAVPNTVYLCRGDVFEEFNLLISGHQNLTLASYPCDPSKTATPIVTGSTRLTKPPVSTSKTAAKKVILNFDVSQYMTSTAPPRIVAVWVNGKRHIPARYPNVVDPLQLHGAKRSEFVEMNAWTPSSVTPYHLNTNDPSRWNGAILRVRDTNWSYNWFNVTSVTNGVINLDTTKGNLRINSDGMTRSALPGFFLENVAAELDAPGEFFYNSTTQILSVIPIDNDTSSDVYITLGGPLGKETAYSVLNIVNSGISISNINLSMGTVGLKFSHNTNTGINVTINNVGISKMIMSGMDMNGVTSKAGAVNKFRISQSSFTDVDNGIYMFGSANPYVDVVQSNFTNIGLVAGYQNQPGAVLCRTYYGTCNVDSSTFKNLGYSAVHIAKGALIQNNMIDSPMKALADGAAIYTWGLGAVGMTVVNNTITNVILNSISWYSKPIGCAIYADDCSDNVKIVGNTIQPNNPYAKGIFLHNSFNDVIINNTLVESDILLAHDSNGYQQTKNTTFMCEPKNTVFRGNRLIPAPGSKGTQSRIQFGYSLPFKDLANFTYVPSNNVVREVSENYFCNRLGKKWTAIILKGLNTTLINMNNNVINYNGGC